MTESLGWLSRRQRDGGIDQIPLPGEVSGELWLCGKHAIASDPTPNWTTVVCLCERHELAARYPEYVAWLDSAGDAALWWPIADMHAPSVDVMVPFVDDLAERLQRGDSLLIHCGAGVGRAGTTAVCILLRMGLTVDAAEYVVAQNRPMAGPEVGAQRDLVRAVAEL